MSELAEQVMSRDEHRERHEYLYGALDELLADYMLHHPGSLPSKIPVGELVQLSYEQTKKPMEVPT